MRRCATILLVLSLLIAAEPPVPRPEMKPLPKDVKPFEYVPANVPFYPKSDRWGVVGENIKKMQKPLDSAESMKHITTPKEFDLKLFVDETKLGGGKPIAMNWDERGRLWVALTTDYPNNKQPEGEGHDRIVICEDTKGDGVCDKVTTFADKLSIPTSLLRYKDGVIVTQAPHTLFLRDTKGTGVCDKREILFTGWGVQDTHAGPSNLHYGFDNWIYGMVGYSGFRGTVGGEQHRFSQGFFRFKLEANPATEKANPAREGGGDASVSVTKLEFLRSVSNNAWGVGFSEEGHLFGSTANGCPSVYMPIPNRYYEAVKGWSPSVLRNIAPDNHFEPITDKVRQVDFHGGFTAAAGSAIYTARTYPKEYWNRIQFVCEPTGHLVAMFRLTPEGSDFKASYWGNLFASDDEWCAPIAAEVGPDGNVWVIDWYNFIVQHNPTPPGFRTGRGAAYETELRDKKFGRIYRVVPKDAKPFAALRLDSAKPEQLVETLKNENLFWRLTAQRLLLDSGEIKGSVLAALWKLTELDLRHDVLPSLARAHVISVLAERSETGGRYWLGVLASIAERDPSVAARRRAVQILASKQDRNVPADLLHAMDDSDEQVRIAAFLAFAELSDVPERYEVGNRLVEVALGLVNRRSDRWLTEAFIAAAARNDAEFLAACSSHRPVDPSARWWEMLGTIAEHHARSGKLFPRVIQAVLDGDPASAEVILARWAKVWPKDGTAKLPREVEEAIEKAFPRLTASGRGSLLYLAANWGSSALAGRAAEIAKTMIVTATDKKQSDESRIAAVKQLAAIAPLSGETADRLLAIITPQSSPLLNETIVEALGSSTASALAVVKRLNSWSPATRAAAIRTLLGRVESTRVLLDALDKGEVLIGELALDQREALARHTDRAIARRAQTILARGGGLPNPDRQKVVDEYLTVTKKTGDAELGKVIFKNNCAKCHRHNGEGAQIGPDLSGVAVHTKEHLLIDILDPSRSVEGNFRVYRVEMKDGRSLNGLLASETKTTIELIDAEAKKNVLQRSEIDELQVSNKSLMPEGFEKTLKSDDLVNLLAFLTKRGKYLPLPLDKVATVVTTKGMFNSEEAMAERLIFRDWSPKTVDGVPFILVDPQGTQSKNAIMLNGPTGKIPPTMPKSVKLPCNAPAKAIHFLGGIGGWSYPATAKGSVSAVVRLHYADGQIEDHDLINGEHFADYIRRVEVPKSKFAFAVRGQQVRYFAIEPKRAEPIKEIELRKGSDDSAPVFMAVTIEGK
jgi:putative membrane-bound dehydrogenase-like protein